MALRGTFEMMLAAWHAAGVEVVALRDLYASLDLASLPRHRIVMQPVPGRSGTLACQADRIVRASTNP
jgi:hypothetical protein